MRAAPTPCLVGDHPRPNRSDTSSWGTVNGRPVGDAHGLSSRGPAPTGQLLLATSSYLGEGHDSPSLDTLFLAFPLAFNGRVVSSVGFIRVFD
jgi:hypothetical protein